MTKRRISGMLKERLSDREALRRHRELMKDPEYAAAWKRLTSQLSTFLADLPEDALADDHEQERNV